MQLTHLQYFGSIYFYSSLIKTGSLGISPQYPYQKAIPLNRTSIAGANGIIMLSLPLVGGRGVKQPLGEVLLSNDFRWQITHWRSIHDGYRKAPWFDEYGWEIEKLLLEPENRLYALNLKLLTWVLNKLHVNIQITETADQRLLQGMTVLSQQLIARPVISVPEGYPAYLQVFSDRMPFIGNLSIIDLLMNEGPAAKDYLVQLAQFREESANNKSDRKLS